MTNADTIVLTEEFTRAIALMRTRKNIFLTGKAGTGKSTLLKILRNETGRNVAVCAPTGIAALNVNGQTVHSLFCFRGHTLIIDELERQHDDGDLKIRNALRSLDLLIIDEVSMVRSDLFKGVEFVLRAAKKSRLPFGGVQVLLVGDPYQLPPVVTNEGQEHFLQEHGSPYFWDTAEYQAGEFEKLELTKVHRQHDSEFINILNEVREGRLDAAGLATLNSRVQAVCEWTPGTLFLTTTNYLADKINQVKMKRLTTPERVFKGWFEGDYKFGQTVPAPVELKLKAGAQVMFTKNSRSGAYVNGSLGTVKRLDETGPVIVTLAQNTSVDVEVYREKWDTVSYERDPQTGRVVERVTGSYSQLPLMPAWAVTIHKSQGRTLDGAYIHLGKGAFAPGQLYVALSRCRTLEGIRLERPVTAADVIVDPKVVEFMRA